MKDEALKLALEALENSLPRLAPYGEQDWLDSKAAITAIKQALASPAYVKTFHGGKPWPLQPAPVQEPVAWIEHEWSGSGLRHLHFERREQSVRDEVMNPIWTPLYTTPPAAPVQEPVATLFGSLPVYETPPVKEPVAWMYEVNGAHTCLDLFEPPDDAYDEGTLHPLYTTPPAAQRQWVGLTDEEVKHMLELFVIPPHHVEMVVRAIEAKLKEKNT